MLKKIRLQTQIGIFTVGLGFCLLLAFIFPIYSVFRDIVVQQVTENSVMMLGQMNVLTSQIFSRLENLTLLITMDERIREALDELERQKGENQIGAINQITDQLLFYKGVWGEISEITIFTDDMELEPYLVSWEYRYVRNKESEEYKAIEEEIGSRNVGVAVLEDERHQSRVIYFRRLTIFPDDEEQDILCITIAPHTFEALFDQRYSRDSSYYMMDDRMRIIAGGREEGLWQDFQRENQKFLSEVPDGHGSEILPVKGENYIVSYSECNSYGIRMMEMRTCSSLMQELPELLLKMILIGILLLGLAIPLAVWFSRCFVRPLLHLCTEMEKVGEGNFEVTVEQGYTNEIGQMNEHFLWMIQRIKELIRNTEKISQQKNLAEFEALQQQINPHFLYNVLDCMNWMAIRAGQENISKVLAQLGSFFRLSLSKGKSVITLREEMARLQNYVALQKLCSTRQIHYSEEIEEDLYDARIIRLILQPFVENAILHGYPGGTEDCEITVSGWSEGNDFYVQISDEGIGVEAEEMESYLKQGDSRKGSYGIYNVDRRIKLYYGENYGVHYLPVRKGTTVLIHLSKSLEAGYVPYDDRG